jgi:uncharacterized protein
LLFNAETRAFAVIDEVLYLQLIRAQETNNVEGIPVDIIDDLVKAKILIEDGDNSLFYRKKFNYYFKNFDSTDLGFAIAPTTFCNFNCPYCYEEGRKPIFMTEEIENQLISFIKKHESVKDVDITWYGGEPLANFMSIRRILEKLGKENAINLNDHSIVTNGYLLDDYKSKYFSDHPLDDLQITIDGNKDIHDKRRVLSNGAPSYETIIRNIDSFFKYNKKTRVSIRVNIDTSNQEFFYDLYKDLTTRWRGELIWVYPGFVRDYNNKYEACFNCECLNHESRAIFLLDLYSNHKANVKFYPRFQVGGCSATNINNYVVGPSGELYKCWNDIGVEDRVIGYLNNDTIPNYDLLCQFMAGPSMFDDEKCKHCNLFPVCDGGCHWLRLKNANEGKTYELCAYEKKHIEQYLEAHYEMQQNSIKLDQAPPIVP